MQGVRAAQPVWNEQGEAYIAQFDDHYFSTDDGAAESHYVFVTGNNLSARFAANEHPVAVIAEVGFGAGLNAAVILHERQQALAAGAQPSLLTYLAIDKHPLQAPDFARAHRRFPNYAAEFALIEQAYPELITGFHQAFIPELHCRMVFIWDDVSAALAQWDGQVDAWLLDGFKPSSNDSMWTPAVYSLMAERSAVGSTVATYSAAGHVRRGLAAVGFAMEKRPGFGKKRQSLQGVFQAPATLSKQQRRPPFWSPTCRPLCTDIANAAEPTDTAEPIRTGAANTAAPVTIIGAGIAGATAAYALQQRGISVTVFDAQAAVAQGASGNRLGLGHPILHAGASRVGDWYNAAFLHSQGWPLALAGRGAIRAASDAETSARWQELCTQLPAHIAAYLPADESHLPFGGHTMPSALIIRPAETVQQLLAACTVQQNCRVVATEEHTDGVQPIDANGQQYGPFRDIILTCANNDLCPDLPLTFARGQIIDVDSDDTQPAWAGKHYLIPGQPACAGASYILHDQAVDLRHSEADAILAALADHAFDLGPWDGSGRASVRALSPDYMPYVGPLPDMAAARTHLRAWAGGAPAPKTPVPHRRGWWCSVGHGSRGLTGACYAATMLADDIAGIAPSTPLAHRQWAMPLRVLLRDLRRG